VSAASYEARKYGIHSAMPIVQAVKLCPQGIYLRGNMKRYLEKSAEIMSIFEDFSFDVQQLSIDEAFLNISGMEGLFGTPRTHAEKLKEKVKLETGLTLSAGIAPNKYIAKIASGISKPNGLYEILPGGEEAFMRPLGVEKIWGAGKKTQEIFKKHGIKSCEEIYRLSPAVLESIFGRSFGRFLFQAVRGQEAQSFDPSRGTHSMSAERTFPYDLYDVFEIETVILDICQTLIWRLLNESWKTRTVSIKIRYEDFTTEISRKTFPSPINSINELYERIMNLFRQKYQKGRGVRLIGAGLMNLEACDTHQAELFDSKSEKEHRLEKSILEINKKFPKAELKRGRSFV
jgi:DNA polymerase-4